MTLWAKAALIILIFYIAALVVAHCCPRFSKLSILREHQAIIASTIAILAALHASTLVTRQLAQSFLPGVIGRELAMAGYLARVKELRKLSTINTSKDRRDFRELLDKFENEYNAFPTAALNERLIARGNALLAEPPAPDAGRNFDATVNDLEIEIEHNLQRMRQDRAAYGFDRAKYALLRVVSPRRSTVYFLIEFPTAPSEQPKIRARQGNGGLCQRTFKSLPHRSKLQHHPATSNDRELS